MHNRPRLHQPPAQGAAQRLRGWTLCEGEEIRLRERPSATQVRAARNAPFVLDEADDVLVALLHMSSCQPVADHVLEAALLVNRARPRVLFPDDPRGHAHAVIVLPEAGREVHEPRAAVCADVVVEHHAERPTAAATAAAPAVAPAIALEARREEREKRLVALPRQLRGRHVAQDLPASGRHAG